MSRRFLLLTLGSIYGPQIHPPAVRPSQQQLAEALQHLRGTWLNIAGAELSDACHPTEFAGPKACRLIVTVTKRSG